MRQWDAGNATIRVGVVYVGGAEFCQNNRRDQITPHHRACRSEYSQYEGVFEMRHDASTR